MKYDDLCIFKRFHACLNTNEYSFLADTDVIMHGNYNAKNKSK